MPALILYKRLCPICDDVIKYRDFKETNINNPSRHELWFDVRIKIPCCSCFNLIKRIKKHGLNILISTGLMHDQIIPERLKEWGIIE